MTIQPMLALRFLPLAVLVCACGSSGRRQNDAAVTDGGALDRDAGGTVFGDVPSTVDPSCGGPGLSCCPGDICRDGGCCYHGICAAAGFACPGPGVGGAGGASSTTGALGGTTSIAGSGGTTAGPGTGGGTGGTVTAPVLGGTTAGPGTGGVTGAAGAGGAIASTLTGGTTLVPTTGGTTRTGASTSGGAGGSAGQSTTPGGALAGMTSGGATAGAAGGTGGATSTGAPGCAACVSGDLCTDEGYCVKPGTIDAFSSCDLAIEPVEGRLGAWSFSMDPAMTCEHPPCAGVGIRDWSPRCSAWMQGASARPGPGQSQSAMILDLRPREDPAVPTYNACKYNAVEVTYETTDRNLSVIMWARWNGQRPYGQQASVPLEGSAAPVTKTIKFRQFGLKCETLADFTFIHDLASIAFRITIHSIRFVNAP